MENDVKNSHRETPGKGKLEIWQAHCQKDEKWIILGSIFAKERLGFHFSFIFHSFFIHFSFNFEKIGNKMKWKMM